MAPDEVVMSDVTGIRPVRSTFLHPNYLFALRFSEGYIFGRVLDTSSLIYDPYDQLGLLQPASNIMTFPTGVFPANTNAISPTNTNQTDVILASNQSVADQHDVLYLPTGAKQLLHGSIGIKPNYVYMYSRYPQGQGYLGRWPGLQPPQTANGDPFAKLTGVESPYDEPTDFYSMVIPPGVHLSFQFFLPGTFDQVQPILKIMFAIYNIQVFNPVGRSSYERKLIGAIATRSVPAAYLRCGPQYAPIEYSLVADSFGKDITPLNLEEATELERPLGLVR